MITGDDSWIFEYDPETKRQSKERHTASSPRPKKAQMSKSKIKSVLMCTPRICSLSSKNVISGLCKKKKTPKEYNGHAEDHTGCRLPELLPKVGTTIINQFTEKKKSSAADACPENNKSTKNTFKNVTTMRMIKT